MHPAGVWSVPGRQFCLHSVGIQATPGRLLIDTQSALSFSRLTTAPMCNSHDKGRETVANIALLFVRMLSALADAPRGASSNT